MDEYCTVCSQSFMSICPNCDHDVPIWSDQCAYCGRPVKHRICTTAPEPGSEEQKKELLRLRGEENILSERFKQVGKGKGVFLFKNLFIMFLELVAMGVALWFLSEYVLSRFESTLDEYYALWPTYTSLAGLLVVGVLLYLLYEIVARHLKACWRRIARDKATRASLKVRLEENRKCIEMLEGKNT